jgi:hypothetical protein
MSLLKKSRNGWRGYRYGHAGKGSLHGSGRMTIREQPNENDWLPDDRKNNLISILIRIFNYNCKNKK